MENKVLLFDADNVKVGETFMRRARQLVKQQRAEWIDDSHGAIRFSPDSEEWEKEAEPKDDDWIYELAKKRLHERKMFVIHTALLIPGYFGIIMFFGGILDNYWVYSSVESAFWFTMGAWTTTYLIHGYFLAKTYLKGFRLVDKEARQAQALAREVDRLKGMGYGGKE